MQPEQDALKLGIKTMMISELMLTLKPDEISENAPIFSPDGLGLDSVDALQLVVALEKHYGLKLPDAEAASQVLHSIDSIAAAISASRHAAQTGPALAPPD